MTTFLTADFSAIKGVCDVNVLRRGNDFRVDVSLGRFERDIRRKVYAKQKALYREFPDYSFDFRLVDASQSSA
jgi:hypothetical protein